MLLSPFTHEETEAEKDDRLYSSLEVMALGYKDL